MLILQVETQLFWRWDNPDIYSLIMGIVGIGLSVVGLIYSKKAFHEAELAKKEAELAKNAAYSAGIVVKTQENLMELQQILHECYFDVDVTYSEATNKLNGISSRIYVILGIYEKDEELKGKTEIIKANLANIKNALEDANPSLPLNTINNKKFDEKLKKNYVYNTTSQSFTDLINNLSTLKGILNSKLIKNQTNGNQ